MKKFKLLFLYVLSLAGLMFSGCDGKAKFMDAPDYNGVDVLSVKFAAELKAGLTLSIDREYDLSGKVTVVPSHAPDATIDYDSSNKAVATVDENGKISTLTAGKTTITATADGKSDTFELTTVLINVGTVELDGELKAGVKLTPGETLNIADKVTIDPEDVTYPVKSYDSSDKTVATVAGDGTITAHKDGKTTITVTVDGKSDSFELEVVVKVDSVTLPDELKDGELLAVSETFGLAGKAAILPGEATDKTESYDSSDKGVAAVAPDGVITALAPGKTTITVTAGGISDTFELTVISARRTSVSLDYTGTVVIPVGATNRIWGHVTVLPAPVTPRIKDIVFSSSAEAVATVDRYGVVIGKAPGTATITVAAINDASVSATLNVKVSNATYYARNAAESAATPWTMTTKPSPNSGNGSSLTAALDGDYKATSATGDPDQTVLSLTRTPGGSAVSAANPMEIVVDMQEAKVVNVFRIIHRAAPSTNNLVRFFGFDEISGSDDGTIFKTIAANVEVVDAQSPVYCSISETTFENSVAYRYIKFSARTPAFCFVHGLTTATGLTSDENLYLYPGVRQLLDENRNPKTDVNNGVVQMANDNRGASVQIQELYLGKTAE